jgi:hypothetical protein
MGSGAHMTLGERLRRHPGLTMTKEFAGDGTLREGGHRWDYREWTITLRYAAPGAGAGASPLTVTVDLRLGTGNPADGSGITLGSVLESVLLGLSVDEEHATWESYCGEWQPGKVSDPDSKRKWREGRKARAVHAQFLRDMAERGGDPYDAWLWETDTFKYDEEGK